MPPVLVLLICTVFVIFLLRLDHKQASVVSQGIWIPTIWMLLIATKPLDIWFGLVQQGDAEGSPLDRAVLSGILCLGLFLLAKRKINWSSIIKENTWLILLISYTFTSILWSDIPYISFKRWMREFIAVVMALLILIEQNPRQAVQSILRRTVYMLIPFSLLLVKFYPQYGVQYGPWGGELMWVGVTNDKNGIGRLCLISIFFLVWTIIIRWQGQEMAVSKYQTPAEVLVTTIALWLLSGGGVSTYSATAVAALLAGFMLFFSLLWMQKHRIWVAKTWGVIIALIFIFGSALPFFVAGGSVDTSLTSVLGRNGTLTGRTDIWARLLTFFDLHPILGYGFGGFWTSITQQIVYGIKEAHNGYLATCLDGGIIGLLLIGMFLWSIVRKTQRAIADEPDWGMLCLGFVLMVVIHNIAEASINSFQRHLTATLLFLSIIVPVDITRKSRFNRSPISQKRIYVFSRRKAIHKVVKKG